MVRNFRTTQDSGRETGREGTLMNDFPSGERGDDEATNVASPAGLKVVSSAELLGGAREIVIRHVGEDYRLRLTRAGKLILNK